MTWSKSWFPRPWSTRSTQWPRIKREGAKQPKMPTMDDQPSFCGRQMTPSPPSLSPLRSSSATTIVTIISGCNVCFSQSNNFRSFNQTKEGAAAVTAKIAREPLDLERRRANRKKARVYTPQYCQHIYVDSNIASGSCKLPPNPSKL